jgi:hypothetical protein
MINPFTIQAKIHTLQQEVLEPLYTMHQDQERAPHDWLLAQTGKVIEKYRLFLEELSTNRLVSTVFKIVKLFGGAEQLTTDDFSRFTSYVTDGGLRAMVKMLLAAEKEKVFLSELRRLPPQIKKNAQAMLNKSAMLHEDFITDYFNQQYGSLEATPGKLIDNYHKSTAFIRRLATLAKQSPE